jgi:type II secretory pathway pseudopilin PulG
MRAALNRRLQGRHEAGYTLVELLVASAMGVVLMGAVGSLVIGTMRAQPGISKRAQNISSARYVLDRMTHEIRNGIAVTPTRAKAEEVSFRTYVRRASCGSTTALASTLPAIECQVTYRCSLTQCTRLEAAPGVYTGTETTLYKGLNSNQVFSYLPSAATATFIKVTLRLPNPTGAAALTVSDGASMRNATLAN